MVFVSVARVLRVKKLSLPSPSTGEFMPASALIWNWYLSAPATGVQAKDGRNWTTAPAAGAVWVGRVTAPRAGPVVRNAMAANAAARSLRSADIESSKTSSAEELEFVRMSRKHHRGEPQIGHPSDEGLSGKLDRESPSGAGRSDGSSDAPAPVPR